MNKGHIIRLKPNQAQIAYFKKACGCARLAYNWGLAEWRKDYQLCLQYNEACKAVGGLVDRPFPSAYSVRKSFNQAKKTQFPFVTKVSKCVTATAFAHLGRAFSNFFKHGTQYPQFRRKGQNERFSIENDRIQFDEKKVQIPKLGWVKMREAVRFPGKVMSAKVFERGGKWFISVNVDLLAFGPIKPIGLMSTPKTGQNVGIDMGIADAAVLSTGQKFQGPKALNKKLDQLKKRSQDLSRKQKGSKNFCKAKTKLAILHAQIANVRKDFMHKTTTEIVRNFDKICIEDLNVSGMMQNHCLARAISDVGMHEFKRQLVYKAAEAGKEISQIGQFFPSSQLCSVCDYRLPTLSLGTRRWACPCCHTQHDRDVNASRNILKEGLANGKKLTP